MNTSNNVQIGRALLDGFNNHNLDNWIDNLSEQVEVSYPGARDGLPKPFAIAYNQAFINAFPDINFVILREIANDERVVIEWAATGTHTAPLQTLSGKVIPATNRSGTLKGMFIVDSKDGKIVREASYWDQLELLAILGLAPA